MRSRHDGHHHMQDAPATPHAKQDEGQRQLDRLIEALTATRALVEQQSQRYAGTQSLAERGDILHAAIIAVEDRLSPRCKLDEIAKVRDAMHIIAGRRKA
jgi:hypothetical protein